MINYDCSKIENYNELRKLQLTQVEILKYVDDFCTKNKIKYSIVYGTVLGAVRHGGFIPWDDDLDICMPREDYEKFIRLWKDTDTYLLQNHSTDPDFTQSFTKIRKNRTAFVQKNDIGNNYNKGIFIDVFPFDRLPKDGFKRKKMELNVMLYNLFMRGYPPENNGKLLKLGSNLLLKVVSKNLYSKKSEKYRDKICKYSFNNDLEFVDNSTFEAMKKHYDSKLFENLSRIKFEDIEVSVFKNFEHFLKCRYGDYMKLPPESEQTWFHHPVYISFEHNFEDIKYE